MPRTLHPDRTLALAIATLGLTSVIAQIVLLREFLSVLSGNELVIGILLGTWMLLTGLGAFAGRYLPEKSEGGAAIIALTCLIAQLPWLTVLLLRILRNAIFPVGGMIGIVSILLYSFVLLFPYCVAAGCLFVAFAREVADEPGPSRVAAVYGLEAIGSVIGGFLLSMIIVVSLPTFLILLFLQLVGCTAMVLLARRFGRPAMQLLAVILAAASVAAFLALTPDRLTKQHLFPGQEILSFASTPYGELTVTRQGDQRNFFENGLLLRSTGDVTRDEEAVHYALIQCPHPRRALVISGGIAGIAPELMKYGLRSIDYVEINPRLVDEVRRYDPWPANAPVHPIVEDARLYVKSTSERYDVVLLQTPEPATAQLNRLYTLEFFDELRRILNPGAVVSMLGPPAAEYYSADSRLILSILCNTLRARFANVLIIPGLSNYVLASDSALYPDIARRIEERGVPTQYVNRYYIDDTLLGRRSSAMMAQLDRAAGINRDFFPTAYYRQLRYWMDYFSVDEASVAIILTIVLAIAVLRSDAVGLGLMTGGFAASSLQVLLLISFQIINGYVYQQMGLLITFFMGGLAVGSLRWPRGSGMRSFIFLQLGIAAYSLILPLEFILLQRIGSQSFLIQIFFYILSAAIGMLTGMEFAAASRIRSGSPAGVASGLYSSDLLGSAVGAILVAAYLIPGVGLMKASWVTGTICLLSAGVAFRARHRYAASEIP